jgi:hypothetical protein
MAVLSFYCCCIPFLTSEDSEKPIINHHEIKYIWKLTAFELYCQTNNTIFSELFYLNSSRRLIIMRLDFLQRFCKPE